MSSWEVAQRLHGEQSNVRDPLEYQGYPQKTPLVAPATGLDPSSPSGTR